MNEQLVAKLQERKYVQERLVAFQDGCILLGFTTETLLHALLLALRNIDSNNDSYDAYVIEQEAKIQDERDAKDAARATFTGQQTKIDALEREVQVLNESVADRCVTIKGIVDQRDVAENAFHELVEQQEVLQAQYDDLSAAVGGDVANAAVYLARVRELEKENDALREQLTEPTAAAEGSELEQAHAAVQLLEHRISVIDEKKQERIVELEKENAELKTQGDGLEQRGSAEANANNEAFRKDAHRGEVGTYDRQDSAHTLADEDTAAVLFNLREEIAAHERTIEQLEAKIRAYKNRIDRQAISIADLKEDLREAEPVSDSEARDAFLAGDTSGAGWGSNSNPDGSSNEDELRIDQADPTVTAPTNIIQKKSVDYSKMLQRDAGRSEIKEEPKDKQVVATQWWRNGDHPQDGTERHPKGFLLEGRVVRRYRHPYVDAVLSCAKCGYIMHDHGWIDNGLVVNGVVGLTVCPGDWIVTGEQGYYPVKEKPLKEPTDEA